MIEPGGHRSLWTFHAAMDRGGNLDELIDVVSRIMRRPLCSCWMWRLNISTVPKIGGHSREGNVNTRTQVGPGQALNSLYYGDEEFEPERYCHGDGARDADEGSRS